MVLIPCLLGALFWAIPFKSISEGFMRAGCNKGCATLFAFILATALTGGICMLISINQDLKTGAEAGFIFMPLFGSLLCCVYRN